MTARDARMFGDNPPLRVLFVSHEADLEDQLCLQRAHLTQFPHMRMYTELMDAHLYLISRSALSLLDTHRYILGLW